MTEIVGIDFGTSTSLAAVRSPRRVRTLPLGRSRRWLPSIVGLDGPGRVAGDDAEDLAESSIIRSIKSSISETKDSVTASDGHTTVTVAADSVIRDILGLVVERVEERGQTLDDEDLVVRLGCPAMWTGEQRRRLIRLANESGIPVADATLVDEPIAAGVAWINKRIADGDTLAGKVLVYDMGGGTLDIAVLNVRASGEPGRRRVDIAVQAADGNDIAGDRVDRALVEIVTTRLRERGFDAVGPELPDDLNGWLLRAAREAKVKLSETEQITVHVEHPLIEIPDTPLFRSDVVQAIDPLLKDSMKKVWEVARASLMSQVAGSTDAHTLTPEQARSLGPAELSSGIDYVLLAGGMSLIPAVREYLGAIFGHDKVHQVPDPNQLVVIGLAGDETYESLNLHRPGFDFVLEWNDPQGQAHERPVYDAHTPFYSFFQVMNTGSVKYTHRFDQDSVPTRGAGLITAKSLTGAPIPLTIDGAPADGIPFEFGDNSDSLMSIEPNGRVFVRDGHGRTAEWFISRWPVIKGRGNEAVAITRTRDTDQQHEWYYDISGD